MKIARRLGICSTVIAAMLLVAAALPLRAATTVDDVSQGLTCQCGCGLTVANCNHPECNFSVPMRGDIAKMIDRGMGRPEIIAFYRAKYGEKILSAPTTEGFNLLAWIMPFAAVLIGGGFVMLMLGRWRRATPSLPSGPEAATQRIPIVDPKLREQLADQVREQL
jgi:cytochrome c-type biogenesis protein CcmH